MLTTFPIIFALQGFETTSETVKVNYLPNSSLILIKSDYVTQTRPHDYDKSGGHFDYSRDDESSRRNVDTDESSRRRRASSSPSSLAARRYQNIKDYFSNFFEKKCSNNFKLLAILDLKLATKCKLIIIAKEILSIFRILFSQISFVVLYC